MEKKDYLQLIENYLLQIGIVLLFSVFVLFVPVLFYRPEFNLRLEILSTRCLFLDAVLSLAFLLYKKGKYYQLLSFSLLGIFSSLFYLWKHSSFMLPFCLSATITSVILSALVLFVSIKVNFRD